MLTRVRFCVILEEGDKPTINCTVEMVNTGEGLNYIYRGDACDNGKGKYIKVTYTEGMCYDGNKKLMLLK